MVQGKKRKVQYIPNVKSTVVSGLSDDVRKKQRLFSEENRQDGKIQSGRREMHTALIHSASDRKRLLRDGRQDKEISVVFSLLH